MSYRDGKSYRGRTFGEKRYERRTWKREETKKPIMRLDKELKIRGCWLFDFKYPRIGGESLHMKFARGNGEAVRHLCGCNRCVQPYHLVRGSDLDNAQDETEILKMGVGILRNISGERYESVSLDEEYLALQSKVSRIKKYNFNNLRDVHQYVREIYRKRFEELFPHTYEMDVEYLRRLLLSIINFVDLGERNEN